MTDDPINEELEEEEPEEKEPTNAERLIDDHGIEQDEAERLLDSFDYDDVDMYLTRSHHDNPVEILLAAIECGISFHRIDENYQGHWNSDEEFVEQLCEDIGDIPTGLASYIHIDWTATARDVMMDYCEHNGHYFRNS